MDYPVTTPFGQVAGYPLNNGFHNGIDYGYPMGTPVVINGVTIGISNNTGATTGPHLHVGKYIGGAVQDPGVGNGFSFNSAVVYDTGYDTTNGNFVRITGDGALWNYLHLESTMVTKGQVLAQKENDMPNDGDIDNVYLQDNGRKATDSEKAAYRVIPWSDPTGLYYGKVRVDFENLQKALQDAQNKPPTDVTVLGPGDYQVK